VNTIIFSLQKRISYLLLDKLRSKDISFDRASYISKKVLEYLPDQIDEDKINEAITKVETIPELSGIGFGLMGR